MNHSHAFSPFAVRSSSHPQTKPQEIPGSTVRSRMQLAVSALSYPGIVVTLTLIRPVSVEASQSLSSNWGHPL